MITTLSQHTIMNEDLTQPILNSYEKARYGTLANALVENVPTWLTGDQRRLELITSAINVVGATERSITVSFGCSREDWLTLISFFPTISGWCDEIDTAKRAIHIIAQHTPLHRQLHASNRLSASLIYPSERLMILLLDRPECTGWLMMLAAFRAMGLKVGMDTYIADLLTRELCSTSHNLKNSVRLRLLLLAEKVGKELEDSLASLHLPTSQIFEGFRDFEFDPSLCKNGFASRESYFKASELLVKVGLCEEPLKFQSRQLQLDNPRLGTGNLSFSIEDSGEDDYHPTFTTDGLDFLQLLQRLCEQSLLDSNYDKAPEDVFKMTQRILSKTMVLETSRDDEFDFFHQIMKTRPQDKIRGGKPLVLTNWKEEKALQAVQHNHPMPYKDNELGIFFVIDFIQKDHPGLKLTSKDESNAFASSVACFIAFIVLRDGVDGRPPNISSASFALTYALSIASAAMSLGRGANINLMTCAIAHVYTHEHPYYRYQDEDSILITAVQGSGFILLTANPVIKETYLDSQGILKYFILLGAFRNTSSKMTFEFKFEVGLGGEGLGEETSTILSVPPMITADILLEAEKDNIIGSVISSEMYRQADYGTFCIGALTCQEERLCRYDDQNHLTPRAYFLSSDNLVENYGSPCREDHPSFCSSSKDPILQYLALSIGGPQSHLVKPGGCIKCSLFDESSRHYFVIPL